MLGEPSLQLLMRLHLKQQESYGSAPFTYLTKEDKLKISETVGSRREVLKLTLFILISLGMWLQIYYEDKSKVELVQRLESFYIASCFSVLCVAKWSIFHHGAEIVELYNLFVSFEKTCIKGIHGLNLNILFYFLFSILSINCLTI